MQRWISVKDRFPSDPQMNVLLTDGKHIWVGFAMKSKSGSGVFSGLSDEVDLGHDGYHWVDDATHWMPLPELPKE